MSQHETIGSGPAVVPPAGGAGLSARQVQIRNLVQAAGMLPVLILLCIGFHYMTDGRFFTGQNVSIVAQQASINTVLAAGMTFAKVIATANAPATGRPAFVARVSEAHPGAVTPPRVRFAYPGYKSGRDAAA